MSLKVEAEGESVGRGFERSGLTSGGVARARTRHGVYND